MRAGLAVVRRLLGDPGAGVRAAAAYTLAWFPEEAAASRPALRALIAAETEPGVLANAAVAAGLLDDHDLVPWLREVLAGEAPLPRRAAAVALARLGATDADIVAGLAEASTAEPVPPVHFYMGDLRGYAASTLAALAGDVPPEAADAVLDGLSRTTGVWSFPMAAAALRIAFGEPAPALAPFAGLTRLQRRTVGVLANLPAETWQWVNFSEIVREWGLPGDRDAFRAYAEIG
ncbi:HEAT repeat domain-containing protein [Actinomadura roseirufa]|uniref:HEAT repeat domain-containing protein n=1 Tax=Actinomadura roseirufa TaxID=2094049 RepID=UPI001F5FE854|nr:HEAT repeat domain-containing protein [Actinomadura roseirufa]